MELLGVLVMFVTIVPLYLLAQFFGDPLLVVIVALSIYLLWWVFHWVVKCVREERIMRIDESEKERRKNLAG